ncbi:hypothetical protein [Rubripirellula amarantea]|nr:hypothetical protein [Rubripirellula amarantea]
MINTLGDRLLGIGRRIWSVSVAPTSVDLSLTDVLYGALVQANVVVA